MARVKKIAVKPQYKYTLKRGKAITQKQFQPGSKGVPLLALIINKRRGAKGEHGLYGERMQKAVESLWKARVSSIAFLRSGWLPAVGAFARAIGKPVGKNVTRAQQRSNRYIGGGTPAKEGWKPLAEFVHAAFSKTNNNPQITQVVEDGMRQAINQEVTRIKGRIESRLASDAQKFFNKVTR